MGIPDMAGKVLDPPEPNPCVGTESSQLGVHLDDVPESGVGLLKGYGFPIEGFPIPIVEVVFPTGGHKEVGHTRASIGLIGLGPPLDEPPVDLVFFAG